MTLEKIKNIVKNTGADAIVTASEDLRRYLSGFASSDGIFVADSASARLYVDSRYIEAAKKALENSEVEVVLQGSRSEMLEMFKQYKTLGVPFNRISYSTYLGLQQNGFSITDSMPVLQQSMAIKDDAELKSIETACNVAEAAFLKLLPELKEGITESEAAAILEYNMRLLGATGPSFETICGFGSNGSVPHHETGNARLKYGDIILLDFGSKVNGYCSDITRTFLFGDDGKHEEFKAHYNAVLGAHLRVLDEGHAGMAAKDVDALARDYLKAQGGLDEYFTHSLGHGIGLNVHEFPSISWASNHTIENGMVFSDEPGVYFEGKYGIRIEDTVVCKDGKFTSLMKTDKKLMIL